MIKGTDETTCCYQQEHLAFQGFAVPISQAGGRVIGTVQEFHESGLWVGCGAHVVVHQQEFFHLRMIEGCGGANFAFRKAGWFGRGRRVECGPDDVASTGPESRAAYLVRVGFAGDGVGSGPFGGWSTREARHRQIEASPEKMHRADFAKESGSELLQNLVDPYQDAPELLHGFRVV